MENQSELINSKPIRILGLDIGITSLGWAINQFDPLTNEWHFDDFGVRIWDAPEDSKTLESNVAKRRLFRSQRRILQRRKQRLNDLKKAFIEAGLLTDNEINEHFLKLKQKNNNYDAFLNKELHPLYLRKKGLETKLTNLQLLIALHNITKNRGYNNMFEYEGLEGNDGRKSRQLASILIEKYHYPINVIFSGVDLNNVEIPEYEFDKKTKVKTLKVIDPNTKKVIENKKIINPNNYHNSEWIKRSIEKWEKELKLTKSLLAKDKENQLLKQKIVDCNKQIAEFTKQNNDQNQILFLRKHYQSEVEALLSKQREFNLQINDEFISKVINDIIFRQRFFESGPGPKNLDSKEKWIDNLRKNPLLKATTSYNIYAPQTGMSIFEEKIGNCTYYRNERRNTGASILTDINFIQNEISKLLATFVDKNSDKKASDFLLQDHFEEIKMATKQIINLYLNEQKFSKESTKEILQKNNLEITKWPSDLGISFATEHLFLIKVKKYNPEFLASTLKKINFADFNSIITSDLEKIGQILANFKTPEKILEKVNDEIEYNLLTNQESKTSLIKFAQGISAKSRPANTSKKFQFKAWKLQEETGELISHFSARLSSENYQIQRDNWTKQLNVSLDSKEFKKLFLAPIKDQDMEQNKVVYRAINQTRIVVKKLFEKYHYQIDKVVIEVASEMYNEKSKRKEIEGKQQKLQTENLGYRAVLEMLGQRPTTENITRYKLWVSQQPRRFNPGEKEYAYDLYDFNLTNKIFVDDLFRDNLYQVDHIIPYSLLNDNSFNNKVLTSTKFNQLKGQRTPYELFKLTITDFNDKKFQQWIQKVKKLIKGPLSEQKILYFEKKVALRGGDGFESKDLNDTRYITKYIANYFQLEFDKLAAVDPDKTVKILTVKGQLTANFRRKWLASSPWGLNKPREITHYHHSVDAMILTQFDSYSRIFFYQSILVLFNTYNELTRQLKANKLTHSEAEVTFSALYHDLKNQYQKTKALGIQDAEFLIDRLYNELSSYQFDLRTKTLNNTWLLKDSKSAALRPLVKDLQTEIEKLIPVQLEIETIEKTIDKINPLTGEKVPHIYNQNEAKFKSIVKEALWSELNHREIKDYPFVSYKQEKRIRGNFLGSQLYVRKSEAYKLDEKTNTKTRLRYIEETLDGQYINIAKYYGVRLFKDSDQKPSTVFRYDLINKKDNELIRDAILTRNTVFRSIDGEVLVFKGVNGSQITSPKNQLNYVGGRDNYNKIIGSYPSVAINHLKNVKILEINSLGKSNNF